MSGNGAPMEYVGGLTFGLAEGKPVEPKEPLETWLRHAREDFARARLILPVLNSTDEQLELIIRKDRPRYEYWLDLMESCQSAQHRYEAGVQVLEAAVMRLIVILERIEGPETMAAVYAEDDA